MCLVDDEIDGTWKPFVASFVRTVPARPERPEALMSESVTSLGEGSDWPVLPTSGSGPPVLSELNNARAAVGSGTTYETPPTYRGVPGYCRKSTFFWSNFRLFAMERARPRSMPLSKIRPFPATSDSLISVGG